MLYVAALFLFAVGTYGLFGNERDPLAPIFLMPLGMPWTWLVAVEALPDAWRPWLGAGAPLVNLLLLWFACRWVSAARSR